MSMQTMGTAMGHQVGTLRPILDRILQILETLCFVFFVNAIVTRKRWWTVFVVFVGFEKPWKYRQFTWWRFFLKNYPRMADQTLSQSLVHWCFHTHALLVFSLLYSRRFFDAVLPLRRSKKRYPEGPGSGSECACINTLSGRTFISSISSSISPVLWFLLTAPWRNGCVFKWLIATVSLHLN